MLLINYERNLCYKHYYNTNKLTSKTQTVLLSDIQACVSRVAQAV
jgi:hypothetical protein